VHYHHFLHKDRPESDVPKSVKGFLILALIMQLLWHNMQEPVVARAEDLPPPLSTRTYVLSSLDGWIPALS
jgi:hypothetical protein